MIEGIGRHLSEIGVTAHQASKPCILQLPGSPLSGNRRAALSEFRRQHRRRGVNIEQGSIRVENAGLYRLMVCHGVLFCADCSYVQRFAA